MQKPNSICQITSSASTAASACIQYLGICRPSVYEPKMAEIELIDVSELLDHYSMRVRLLGKGWKHTLIDGLLDMLRGVGGDLDRA